MGEPLGCETYCSHGGVCERDRGHEGPHDTGFCQFTDDESISKEEADAIIASSPGGQAILAQYEFTRALIRAFEETSD